MSDKLRIKVTEIHPCDRFYEDRERFVGRCGSYFSSEDASLTGIDDRPEGYSGGFVDFDNPEPAEEFINMWNDSMELPHGICFYAFKFEILEGN